MPAYKHGQDRTNRLYRAWCNMRQRCHDPNSCQWKDYGGRGIQVCIRWDDYELFAADMGPHPGKGWTLDRRNNDKNYSKANCRWATYDTQNRNRRDTSLSLSTAEKIRSRTRIGTRQRPGNALALAAEFGITRKRVYDIYYQRRWSVQ